MDYGLGLDQKALSKELKLLLFFIREENLQDVSKIPRELLTDIDWDLFLRLAWHHRVHPIIYSKIKMAKSELIPSYILQQISNEYRKNTFQMLHLSAEMEYLCKQLADCDIRCLSLKGPVLAVDLYGEISLRTSCDLDILIDLNDLDTVEALLVKFGYVKDDYIQTVLEDWKWRHHHITFFHSQKQIKVEVHWRLNPGPAKEPTFRELWERRRRSTITKSPIYILGKEDLFLFLVSHGARHGWSRLRWLMDINQIARQKVDWKQLELLLKKYQFEDVGGQALVLASQLLNTPIIEDHKRLLEGSRPLRLAQEAIFYIKQMINLHNEPLTEEVSRYHKRYLFSLMSSQQKILFILSFLYPYPEDAATLPLPKNLHILYFPLRPVLWAWRKTRKHAVS